MREKIMFKSDDELASWIEEMAGASASQFSETAFAGGAFMSGEQPFDFHLVTIGAGTVSGDRWSGDDYGKIILDAGGELELNVPMQADEFLLVRLKVDGLFDDFLGWLSSGFSSSSDTNGQCFYDPATQMWTMVSPVSDGSNAIPKLSFNTLQDQSSGQSDWTVFAMEIRKVI